MLSKGEAEGSSKSLCVSWLFWFFFHSLLHPFGFTPFPPSNPDALALCFVVPTLRSRAVVNGLNKKVNKIRLVILAWTWGLENVVSRVTRPIVYMAIYSLCDSPHSLYGLGYLRQPSPRRANFSPVSLKSSTNRLHEDHQSSSSSSSFGCRAVDHKFPPAMAVLVRALNESVPSNICSWGDFLLAGKLLLCSYSPGK